MKKMSVAEYADSLKISVQSVYQKAKRGYLTTSKENGITYVLLEEDIKPDLNEDLKRIETDFKDYLNLIKPKDAKKDCKDLLKIVKSQNKEIKRLTKELTKAKNEEVQTLKAFIGEMKQLSAPKPAEEDFIDLEEEKPKKKKKKKKKK